MKSINERIEARIVRWKRGRIFFNNDFADLGGSDVIRQVLGRLTKEGKIIRIARGIYYYPKTLAKAGASFLNIPPLWTISHINQS